MSGLLPPRCGFVPVEFGARVFEVAVPRDVADPLACELAAGRCPRSPTYDLFRAVLAGRRRVLDVGAHLGTFSLSAVAAGCEAIAVEASPRNAACLRATVSRNRLAGLAVVEAAAAASDGWLDFHENGPWGFVATVLGCGEQRVRAVALDGVVGVAGCGPVDFVKLDVEGSEPDALRGMAGLLADADAPPVIYEANSVALENVSGTATEDLHAAFAARGYRLYGIEAGELVAREDGEPDVELFRDFLAVKGEMPAVPGFRVRAPRTPTELGEWIARTSRSGDLLTRVFLRRELGRRPDLAAVPGVEEAQERLARDPAPEVRHAGLRLSTAQAGARWLDPSAPPTMRRGECGRAPQTILNTSAGPWPDATRVEGTTGAVVASYHWLRRDGALAQLEGATTPLGRTVEPGETERIELQIQAPDEPGDYLLQLVMLQVDVRWFPADGPRLPVRVV